MNATGKDKKILAVSVRMSERDRAMLHRLAVAAGRADSAYVRLLIRQAYGAIKCPN